MAIITLSRQVAAHGDEIAQALAKKLNYKFIRRTDIEERIIALGFPKDKMPKYDERKPGFFASLAKDRDAYINLTQYALLEAASKKNVIVIGRGAFAVLKNAPNEIAVRFIADEKTRMQRLMKEFNWDEKQAKQRITESDLNRDGFHKNFYNVEVSNPENYDMVLNTSIVDDELCAQIISDYVAAKVTPQIEEAGNLYISQMLKAQEIVNKLIFEQKINIEFMHADIEDGTFVLYGVTDSAVTIEQALTTIKKEMPDLEVKSSVSVVHDFKAFQ